MLINWKRGDNLKVGTYFSAYEFECQCGRCIDQQIESSLVSRLDVVRRYLNTEVNITSGYRCAAHQAALSKLPQFKTAQKISQHVLGNAADWAVAEPKRHEALNIALDLFNYVGIAATFFHTDVRENGKKIWLY